MAVLLVRIQLETTPLVDVHQAPPPLASGDPTYPLNGWVAPFCSAKPRSDAPSVSQAQRTASGPLPVAGSRAPWMIVAAGPFTLATVSALFSATRLVKVPAIALPPVA